MSYELNEHQIEARERTIKYITNHLDKRAVSIETTGEIESNDLQLLKESGVWEYFLDSKTDWITKVTVLTEIAKTSPSVASLFTDVIMSKALLSEHHDSSYYSIAFAEENAGSDLSAIETEARKVDDYWIVSGEKWFVANVDLAEKFLVLAKTSDTNYSLFKIAKEQDGIIIQDQKKMGLEGLKLSKVILNQVSIPSSALVATLDANLEAIEEAYTFAKLSIASLAIGISERALHESLERARNRHQFGKSIGEYQAIQFKVAETTVGINAAKTLIYLAAQKLDRNEDAQVEASMAKVYSTESASKAVNHAVQIHGSHGILNDSIVSQLYRSQRLTEIFGQTSEMQRLTIANYVINNIGINEKEENYGLSI